jgi:hypothetical protein
MMMMIMIANKNDYTKKVSGAVVRATLKQEYKQSTSVMP